MSIITFEQLEEIESFKIFSATAKMIYKRRNVREHLTNGLRVAKYMGYDKWEPQSGFSNSDKKIIFELLNKEQCL